MEKDDEVKGVGNSIDFGARMLDPRLGRWFAVDKFEAKYPFISPYSYSLNSVMEFIDPDGNDPKVAIIIAKEGKKYDFDGHYNALKAKGYTIMRVETGKQALEVMKSLGTKESPIENLILLSHASPGGLSNGEGGGIYTEMELEFLAKDDYTKNVFEGLKSKKDKLSYEEELELYKEAVKITDIVFSSNAKDALIKSYKEKKEAITTKDVAAAMKNGEVATKNLSVVLGGCNTAGYVDLDEQDIFAEKLSQDTNSEVTGSRGFTQPINNTTKRKSDYRWITYTPDGKEKKSKNNVIDLTNP